MLLSSRQSAPLGLGRPTLLGLPQGPWSFLLICSVVAHVLGPFSHEKTGTVLQCGSRDPSLEGVWARAVGQTSENTNSAYVWRRGYGGPDVWTMRGGPRVMKTGREVGRRSGFCLWML